MSSTDPRLWLEEVDSDASLDWVKQRNAKSVELLASDEAFRDCRDRLLKILDSSEKIVYVNKVGEHYYNFWRDAQHERGIWRRTTWASYRCTNPDWDVLLDLDELAAEEKENWVWHGASFLKPDLDRCLVALSRGGADAEVLREFDISSRTFVQDGFRLPEAKSQLSWIDRDCMYVCTDFGKDSMTESGYPRIIRRWQRGTPLIDAQTVFEGNHEDVSVRVWHDPTRGWERDFVRQNITFYKHRLFEITGLNLKQIIKPADALADIYKSWILLVLRSPWRVADKTFAAGSLLVADYQQYLDTMNFAGISDGGAGGGSVPELEVLFEPTTTTSLQSWSWTCDHLVLNILDNVLSRIDLRTPTDLGWTHSTLETGLPENTAVSARAMDADGGNALWFYMSGYLTPPGLWWADVGCEPELLKSSPAWFDSTGLEVSQHFANSKDGTQVPYFQVGKPTVAGSVQHASPTLLYAYGGFEISLLPDYSGSCGAAWLEAGGTYVVANIRGGGEYGPAWHQAALQQHRHRAYEDFVAVGEDLVKRNVATPQTLGIMGGSNGGLLMGNMYTQYPGHWGAVVCAVPLLDMQRYSQLLAGASWIAEYGDPNDPEQWAFMQQYSPYHNIDKDADYPPILFTTSTRDDRVHPGHARKMAHALLEAGKNVCYYENVEGGHGGAANNAQMAFMSALEYQFLWHVLGHEWTGRRAEHDNQ